MVTTDGNRRCDAASVKKTSTEATITIVILSQGSVEGRASASMFSPLMEAKEHHGGPFKGCRHLPRLTCKKASV
jgi:hypothetical protein